MSDQSNTLKKRLDEKDIQAETLAGDIDAQKTRHDELKRTLEDKEEDMRRTAIAAKLELQEAIVAEHAHTDKSKQEVEDDLN